MKKEYNYGLAILRMLMCFMVVLVHCWDAVETGIFFRGLDVLRGYAVVVFMAMAFALGQKQLVELNKTSIKRRFERLIIPQVGWAIIYWGAYSAKNMLFHHSNELTVKDLLLQIVLGHTVNQTMWYQADLIYITILFIAVIVLFKSKHSYALGVIGVLAIIAQYSGANLIFGTLPEAMSFPLGRIAEMLPVAVVAFMLSQVDFFEKAKQKKLLSILLSLVVLVISIQLRGIIDEPGYCYSGIDKVFVAISLVIMFYCLPLENIGDGIKRGISLATNYTLGIYCMHRLILSTMDMLIKHAGLKLVLGRMSTCLVIYVVCFLCSLIGTKIFKKTKLVALFN